MKEEQAKRPKITTWAQRMAWLRRMPLQYKILFGTQAIIFTLAVRFRLKDIERIRLKVAEEEQQASNSNASR